MISILVVAHAGLAQDFHQVVSTILDCSHSSIHYIGAHWGESREEIAGCIHKFFSQHEEDVLVFSDLFGSTHSNLCLPYLKRGHVEMIAGFNLPMLMKVINSKEAISLRELVDKMVEYGQSHIYSAHTMVSDKDGRDHGGH